MDNTVNKRYNSLKEIYSQLAMNGLIDENKKIDFSMIMRDLYYLNLLIYQSYLIFKSNSSKNEKIKKLMELKDGDGKYFISKEMAENVLKNNSKNIINLYDSFKEPKYEYISLDDLNKQKGGYLNKRFYENNFVERLINDENIRTKAKKIVDSPIIRENLNLNNINFVKLSQFALGVTKGVVVYGLNWVFFPLYQLENLPIVGPAIGVPLDIIGVMIDNMGIIGNLLGPVIPIFLQLFLTLGSAIPIPVVNSAFAGLSAGSIIASRPLQWLAEHFIDLIGMFYNISRKQWGLAYLGAMNIFPLFAKMVDVASTMLFSINKALNRGNNLIEGVTNTVSITLPIAIDTLRNPLSVFSPGKYIDKVIKPNLMNSNLFEKYPLIPVVLNARENIENVKNRINNITNYSYNPEYNQLQYN